MFMRPTVNSLWTPSALASANRTAANPARTAGALTGDAAATPIAGQATGNTAQLFDRLSLNFTRESLARDTASFADSLRQKLAAAGIDLSVAPVLTVDGEGRVRVANNHPDKDKIESVIAEDRGLRQQFGAISAQSSLLRAVDSQTVFAADYARAGNDPTAIAGVNQRQMAYNRAQFFLAVGAKDHTPMFSAAMRV